MENIYFKNNGMSESIIDTKKLVEISINDEGGKKSQISNSLIIVKSIRKLTNSIDKNSKESDKLNKMGLIISATICLFTYSQIILQLNEISRLFLLGNIGIIIFFILVYRKIFN